MRDGLVAGDENKSLVCCHIFSHEWKTLARNWDFSKLKEVTNPGVRTDYIRTFKQK